MQSSRLTQVKFGLRRVGEFGDAPEFAAELGVRPRNYPVRLRIMHDVIVIGGGVIGLSIARELASSKSVLLLDRGPTGQGTSHAAAGMLTPLSEADNDGPFFQLCNRSFSLYEEFVRSLVDETGIDCGNP